MSQITHTNSSTRHLNRWRSAVAIPATALLMLVLATGPANAAVDLRSPDARDAALQAQSTPQAQSTGAQDLRSADARDAVQAQSTPQVQSTGPQDLRSADARDVAVQAESTPAQNLRSPDSRDLRPVPLQASSPSPDSSDGFDWGYVAIGGGLTFLLAAGMTTMTVRRRRRLGTAMAVSS
jgi:hypothetical protein